MIMNRAGGDRPSPQDDACPGMSAFVQRPDNTCHRILQDAEMKGMARKNKNRTTVLTDYI